MNKHLAFAQELIQKSHGLSFDASKIIVLLEGCLLVLSDIADKLDEQHEYSGGQEK